MLRMQILNPFRQRDRQPRAARVLSAIAGAACGHSRTRRGSAIVLSVSALVLLSVLTLVYWGLGRSDAHTAVTLRRKADVNATVDQFKDYLASVIARDKTAWYAELSGTGITNPPVVYREAWDFPWVDSTRRSIPDVAKPSAFDRTRFDPAGTMPQSWDPVQTGLNIEAFDGSDPFLAPHQPIFLGMTPALKGSNWMLGARDWWSVSNFAPDGRFVNLYNLRNNFEARSGFSNKRQPNAGTQNSPPQAMSDYLSLLRANGTAWTTKDDGSRAIPNIPADWSMRQRSAFRPTVEVRYDINDPRNAFYQWADTDGDGFFDARWFELVDASVNNRLISLLPQDDSFRWFFAARAVDLTGLVNVNTATDLRGGEAASSQGDDNYRVGATPADIDFLRILMMADTSRQNFVDPNTQGGYVQLLQGDPATGTTPIPADYTGYTMAEAASVAVKADEARSAFFSLKAIPPFTPPPPPFTLSALDRYEQYKFDATGVIPGEAMVKVIGAGNWQTTSVPLFGMPSLYELLTYRGTNDDANTSPLERVLGGRYDIGYFSPLRDNRPLFLEKLHAELAITNTANPGQAAFESMVWSAMDIRQLITTISGANEIRSSRLRFIPTIDPITNAPKSFLEAVSQIGGTWNLDPANPRANFEGRYNAQDTLFAAARAESPRGLFRAYAEALLPHAAELNGDWTTPGANTLFYAHNPVRALITAAHMTANAIDMYDFDSDQGAAVTVLTVATSEQDAARLDNDPRYPAWNRVSQINPGNFPYQMLLDQDERQIQSISGEVPAVNIFGIEAQPFVIETNTYFMYSDVWNVNGGDDDGGIWITPPAIGTPEPFTINGDVTNANPDFIMEAIAFHITNPFDTPISLWSPAPNGSKFYIEFEGNRYPLGNIQTTDDYAISDDYAQLVTGNLVTLNNVILAPGESQVLYAMSFKDTDINGRLDATDFTGTVSLRIQDWAKVQFGDKALQIPVATRGGPTNEPVELVRRGLETKDAVVKLWRVLDLVSDSGVGELQQTPADDLLVDRLRDPGTTTESTLDRTLPTGQNSVAGSLAFQEIAGPGNWRDNEGYSIVRSGSIRRVSDGVATAAQNGEFPSWCIERKYDTSLNFPDDVGGPSISIALADFTLNSTSSNVTAGTFPMEELFAQQALPTGDMLFATLNQQPWEKNNEPGSFPNSVTGLSFVESRTEIHLDNLQFVGAVLSGQKLRTADMLLPMGVGPMQIPTDNPRGSIQDDNRWTTLGESMALALGFDTVDQNEPGDKLLRDLHIVFDRGQLRLDTKTQITPNAYVPFDDLNTNGVWDQGEPTRGAGVPIAYNVLDVFTTTDATYGSMRRPRLGVINVNTAPLNVLRTIPLLTPPSSADGNPGRWWWSGAPDAPTDRTDAAASVFAYVHKGVIPSVSTVVDVVDFSDNGLFGDPQNTARAVATKFDGIRETPGIRSLGELMAVRGGAGNDTTQDIDHLGADSLNIEMKGVESILYQDKTAFDDIRDDYDEKLAVINAVLGTTSVRSDYYAVWFIVQGYQRNDVEGLRPQDPLTPTVSKRFVMVVDRTNVQRLGDKPRILLFQEVPM